MPALIYRVRLTETERILLTTLVQDSSGTSLRQTRARILLKAAEGCRDQDSVRELGISPNMIAKTRRRWFDSGLMAALGERQSKPRLLGKLSPAQAARILELARSEPPAGRNHWSLRQLAEKVVELKFAESFSGEGVRLLLQKLAPDWEGIRVPRRRSSIQARRSGTRVGVANTGHQIQTH
jgi:transposase